VTGQTVSRYVVKGLFVHFYNLALILIIPFFSKECFHFCVCKYKYVASDHIFLKDIVR
jgi:hypothetical protein